MTNLIFNIFLNHLFQKLNLPQMESKEENSEPAICEVRDVLNSNSKEFHQRKNPFSPFSSTKSKLRIQILQFSNGCFLRF